MAVAARVLGVDVNHGVENPNSVAGNHAYVDKFWCVDKHQAIDLRQLG